MLIKYLLVLISYRDFCECLVKLIIKMNLHELKIISSLDEILKDESIRKTIDLALSRAKERFTQSTVPSITEIIPLSIFGDKLPKEINLCRLFILKANTKSKIERHTNSYQRTYTLYGEGDTKILENNIWKSNVRKSLGSSINDKWLSVPEDTWHEPIALSTDWVTITFHTASEDEIVDEYKE